MRSVRITTVFRSLLLLPLAGLAACHPPPPVGRAANPTPPPMSRPGTPSESAELLKQLDAMQKELKERPRDQKIRMALGKLYYENERFLDAASMFREALDANPQDLDALKLFGNCMFFLGNADMAVKQHEQVLAAQPNDIDSLFFLGAILVESRPQDRAALKRAGETWARFLELSPTHPRSKEIAEQLEVVRKAERGEITLGPPDPAAQQAAQAGPQEPEANDQGVMGGQRSFDGAPAGGGGATGPRYKKGTRVPALAADATPLDKARAQALDALDEGRFADARKAAEEALLLAQDDVEMQVARARSMVQLGETEKAIRAFGEVIKRNPTHAPAWHYLGMAHMMGGDPARAAQTWKDLLAMNPEYAREHRLDMRAAMAERMAKGQQ